jgi:ribosomal protein S18 acetylase RimI-like enzyme
MAGQAIEIRAIGPGDQEAARRLILAGLGEHFGYIDETCNPDIDDIATNYVARGDVFLVAMLGGELAGTGALIVGGPEAGRVVRVSVAPAQRRRGIGRALVAGLMEAARTNELRRLWVETNDDWDDAIALYRSCGFREYRRSGGSAYLALDLACNLSGPPT